MYKFVRYGVAAVAATVAIGGLGFGLSIANAESGEDQPTVVKREDTAVSWDVPALDDDGPDAGPQGDDMDSQHSALTRQSINTKSSVNSVNTKASVNSVNTKASVNSVNTKASVHTTVTKQSVDTGASVRG